MAFVFGQLRQDYSWWLFSSCGLVQWLGSQGTRHLVQELPASQPRLSWLSSGRWDDFFLMFEISVKSPRTLCIRHRAGTLRIGLLFVFSSVSASSTPPPEIKQARTSVSLPRNYCLGNVASLGTGLVRAPVPSGSKFPSHKGIPWTGWIRSSASGKYEFSLPNSAGRIFVDQQQIFARSAKSSKPIVIQVELLTNRYYAITVETPNSEDSTLPLQWRRPNGRHETVPKAYLYAPVATAGVSETNT